MKIFFLAIDNSDATYNSRRVYKIKNDLNISASSADEYAEILQHGLNYQTMFHIGTVILNANFPPYTYSQHSTAPTVVCVSSSSKSKSVGVGGEPKNWLISWKARPLCYFFSGGAWLNLYAFQE